MWDYNIDNSEYNIESLKDCLIRANIFLEKMPKDRDYSEVFSNALKANLAELG